MMMEPGSRGAVGVGRCIGAVVVEVGTQLMKPKLAARVEPVEQSWACGAGGGGAKVGAGIYVYFYCVPVVTYAEIPLPQPLPSTD